VPGEYLRQPARAFVNKENGGTANMDEQPSSIANFVEPGPESVRLKRARVRLELSVHTGSRHGFYQGLTDALSATGIFVATHVTKPVGEQLEFSLRLQHSSEPITGVCEVRWLREYTEQSDLDPGMGLRFVELSAGGPERIQKFLEQEEALFFDED
jgi:uncharacterized protein (TIGR02266 family)